MGTGAVVIIACRSVSIGREALEDIKNISGSPYISCEELNLASFASVRAFVDGLTSKGINNIYALINNAGVFYCPYSVTEDGFEITFQTNYLGPFLLTNLLLKAGLLGKGSRVVNVSSESHRFVNDYNVISQRVIVAGDVSPELDQFIRYGQTKFCLNLFTLQLAELNKNTIYAFSVNPGNVETGVLRHFLASDRAKWWPLLSILRPLLVKTPHQGAQTVVHVTLFAEHQAQRLSGAYLSDCKPHEPSKLSQSNLLAEELWYISLKWSGLDS
ncbi:retinol dehydrogenase 11-like [Nilaparvata lugens]|uniref:retinol dehydrogenase 11-like n=1 Tax=Nilaparvata lugens TaxID=108931 RepID=UPI00193DC869|nr:retinol dehydrogenase 11-like [Nilaparvata lugens]